MSSSSTIHLTLPQWDGGSRKVRFIYLANPWANLTSFSLTECPNQSAAVPLYLGADLFSNTDIRTENHPRHHAKFAKKGLATKIHFSSAFRFHGLKVPTVNNSLWFYSIQGLFRVAFEMYSKQEQLAVLENFQDVWKMQINASPLKTSYSLSVQLDLTPSSNVHDAQSKEEMSLPRVGQESVDAYDSDTGDPSASADHDYCSQSKQTLHTEPRSRDVSTVRRKLQDLHDKLSESPADYLETILLLLETVNQCMSGNLEEKDVKEAVLALLKAKDWGGVYSSPLLCCVGRWLGQQFHAANSSISHKVEGFKVHHIERISDLPPAEELTTELFPEAMRTLLLHWMGLSDESTLEKRRSEYPILLLILEFANHNLITGVAHVLYSSLICK
ncbi:uncharacterized protein si:ch211-110p13.9 [Labrus bergylta]|uniref:uncharacterized protein si:ch211-110p13.9 n=1 Tax=Labrus bergylta TaxID=56723 RepID=UPI0009B34F7B|nr:uncharacterized protein LOC110000591 [Labrus bergylta]